WASFSDDEMCLSGASATAHGPGALLSGAFDTGTLPARSRSMVRSSRPARCTNPAFVAPADPSASNATSRSPTPPVHRARLAAQPLSPSSPRVRHLAAFQTQLGAPQSLSTDAGTRASGKTGHA